MSEVHTADNQAKTDASALELVSELDDAGKILAYRATLVRTQYHSLSPETDEASRTALLSNGRSIPADAQVIVLNREANYRVPWQRVADWRLGPTVSGYGYIWPDRTRVVAGKRVSVRVDLGGRRSSNKTSQQAKDT